MTARHTRYEYDYILIKDTVLAAYDYRCANCRDTDSLEIHHVVPLSLGGTNEITNLVPLCHRCHKTAHCGRHISHYTNKKNVGSKPNLSDEEAKKVLDSYFLGEIGTSEVKRMFGWSEKNRITDSPQFKKYIKDNDIKHYRNNVDVIEKNGVLYSGRTVGYVVYGSGERVDMIYP